MPEHKTADLFIEQRPVSVSITCPYCETENRWDYKEFSNDNGQPPDWNGMTRTCPSCGKQFRIDTVYWD